MGRGNEWENNGLLAYTIEELSLTHLTINKLVFTSIKMFKRQTILRSNPIVQILSPNLAIVQRSIIIIAATLNPFPNRAHRSIAIFWHFNCEMLCILISSTIRPLSLYLFIGGAFLQSLFVVVELSPVIHVRSICLNYSEPVCQGCSCQSSRDRWQRTRPTAVAQPRSHDPYVGSSFAFSPGDLFTHMRVGIRSIREHWRHNSLHAEMGSLDYSCSRNCYPSVRQSPSPCRELIWWQPCGVGVMVSHQYFFISKNFTYSIIL